MTEHPRSTVFERTGSFGGLSEEARQAIIEHNRRMKEQREWAAANRERIDAEWDALESPPRTIAQHLASEAPTPSPISTTSPEVPSTRPVAGEAGQGDAL